MERFTLMKPVNWIDTAPPPSPQGESGSKEDHVGADSSAGSVQGAIASVLTLSMTGPVDSSGRA